MKGIGPPGGLQGGQAPFGGLVRGPPVGGEVGVEGLDHHPLAGRDGPERGQVGKAEGAGIGVGEETGLLAHQAQAASR